jgi:hypothetical protein
MCGTLADTRGQIISDNDSNLCSAGKSSSVKIINGLYTWSCSFADSAYCIAYPPANPTPTPTPTTQAKCGSATYTSFNLPYQAGYSLSDINNGNLCYTGAPGGVSVSNTSNQFNKIVTWVCGGQGLIDMSCSSYIIIDKNSICGTAAKTYPSTATSYGSDTFCQPGFVAPSPEYIGFPRQGSYMSWNCDLPSGVIVAGCSANVTAVSCLTSWDCPTSQICSSLNTCYTSSQDCRFGTYEPNGQCGCMTDSECRSKELKCTGASGSWTPGGTPPIYGSCVSKGCTTSSDCDALRICTQGSCGKSS